MTPRGSFVLPLAALLVLGTATSHAGWAGGPLAKRPIPLERTGGGWIVEAKLNGRVNARFLLDSGATWCALSERTAARLRLSQAGHRVPIDTAGGTIRAPVVRLGSVDVGGRKVRDVQAIVLSALDEDLDGILGLNFLNQFRYAIDPRSSVLRLD